MLRIVVVIGFLWQFGCLGNSQAKAEDVPPVAVHVSEATAAHWNELTGPHKEWQYWHIWGFLLEALKGDGTQVVILNDKSLQRGDLLAEGRPKFPILISLASTCMSDGTAKQIDDYVRAGGHLYLGSTGATHDEHGKPCLRDGKPCFALATLDLVPRGMKLIGTAKKVADDPLVENVRSSEVINWLLPRAANSTGYAHPLHWIQQVEPGKAKVLLESDGQPILCTVPGDKGRIIYHSEFCPMAGYSGYVVDNLEYSFFRNAINQAYQAQGLPLVRKASWPYPAVAAFKTRHDHYLHKAASDLEARQGIRGEWLLRTNAAIGSGDWPHFEHIVKSGALIGSHTLNEYTLDSGSYEVAHDNVSKSLDVLAKHLGKRPQLFVAPGMMAFRDSSVKALVDNGLLTTGDMSHGPFPSFALKIGAAKGYGPDVHWPILEIPVSRSPAPPNQAWHNLIYSHMEDMPIEVIRETVDLTYDLGGVINVYDHVGDPTSGIRAHWPHPSMEHFTFYLKHGLSKPRIWKTDPLKILTWWKQRAACQVRSAELKLQPGMMTLVIGVDRQGTAPMAVDVRLPTGTAVTKVSGTDGQAIEHFVQDSLLKIRVPASGEVRVELRVREGR